MSAPTMSGPPARWVLAGGRAHLLAGERPGAVLVVHCGSPLPLGVLAHDRLPSRHLCQVCFTAYLLPGPRFGREIPIGRRCSDAAHETPAGRRLRTSDTPGGQPAPASESAADVAAPDHGHHVAGGGDPVPPLPLPRWVRCPTDHHLHLLTPGEVEAAGVGGHGRAGCGRLIPAVGLTIDGATVAGWCVSCLAVGTAR